MVKGNRLPIGEGDAAIIDGRTHELWKKFVVVCVGRVQQRRSTIPWEGGSDNHPQPPRKAARVGHAHLSCRIRKLLSSTMGGETVGKRVESTHPSPLVQVIYLECRSNRSTQRHLGQPQSVQLQ